MLKAIILTHAPINERQKDLLLSTDILKIALNHHCNELKPDLRFCSDYVADKLIKKYKQPVYSTRDNNAINVGMPYNGSSLIDCTLWLLFYDYEVLLIADNTVNTPDFQIMVKNKLKNLKNVYKYSKKGNFELPYKSIKDFLDV